MYDVSNPKLDYEMTIEYEHSLQPQVKISTCIRGVSCLFEQIWNCRYLYTI